MNAILNIILSSYLQLLVGKKYFVECTAGGGSPDVGNIYATYENSNLETARQLVYSSAEASAQFDRPDR